VDTLAKNLGDDAGLEKQHGAALALEERQPRRAAPLVGVFAALSVLVALRATQVLDEWALSTSQAFTANWLDFVSSFITLLGNFEVTGGAALALALRGWRRKGAPGLAPLLLFVGVAIELGLKYALPHPGPPAEFSHHRRFFALYTFPTPYSFPSGHMLRTTFLASYLTAQTSPWGRMSWGVVPVMAISLLYLNDHWMSDVLGGGALGLAFALAAIAFERNASFRPQRAPNVAVTPHS